MSEPIRLLLVEDNPADARLLKENLAGPQGPRFDVRVTDTVSAAEAEVLSGAYDAILLDLGLPDSEGLSALQRLAPLAQAPIIVLTGLSDAEVGMEAVRQGAQDYLVKGQVPPGLLARSVQYAIERRRTHLDMLRARDQALEFSQLKSRFLANVSHEIRTPLHGILGMTELLERTGLTPEQAEYARSISAAGDGLLRTVNDILDLSRIESGHLELEPRPFCLADLAEEMLEIFAPGALARGVEVASFVDPALGEGHVGDRDRVRQVLANLVGNAVKFTEAGEVTLSVGPGAAGTVRFEVEDSGPGVAPEHRDRIFEAFFQVPGSMSPVGGTGLGLAIARELVHAMGGTLGVDSGGSGGARFWFEVPLGGEPRPARGPRGDKRVLVAMRAPRSRELVARTLRAAGIPCDTCGSLDGEPTRLPDVVLLDPALDAEGTPWLSRTKVLLLVPLTEAGRPGPLARPLRRERLLARVREFLGEGAAGPSAPEGAAEQGALRPLSARVLVAEDDPISQRVLVLSLEKMGCVAEAVSSGSEAVEALRAGSYDLVFMDCHLKELDGIEATRRIRTLAHGRRIPIVALTAQAMQGDRERCLEAGMDDYASKPLRGRELEDLVRRWVRNGALERETTP